MILYAALIYAIIKDMKKKRMPGGGRKKILSPCPFCRLKFGIAEMRSHITHCPKRRRP